MKHTKKISSSKTVPKSLVTMETPVEPSFIRVYIDQDFDLCSHIKRKFKEKCLTIVGV